MFPVLLFCLIWAHLLIHNATHGNLPHAINRVAGELLGLCVIVRYASWDIIHMRHHKHTDDPPISAAHTCIVTPHSFGS